MTRFRFSALFVLALFVSDGSGQSRRLEPPILSGTCLDVDINGNILVVDGEKSTVRWFSRDRTLQKETGGAGWGVDQFDHPAGIWARNGIDVFVADYGNHRIQRFDRNLNYISTLYTRESPNPDERFGYPSDVALSRLGYLFICDTENSRIVKVNQFTQVERTFGGFGAGEGRLYSPTQVECGPKDHVYVVDGGRLLVYDNFGNFMRPLPGIFRPPLTVYANNASVVVVDSTSIYGFDSDERPVCSIPIEIVPGVRDAAIRSVAFSQDSMFVLTGSGLFAVPDPRDMGRERR